MLNKVKEILESAGINTVFIEGTFSNIIPMGVSATGFGYEHQKTDPRSVVDVVIERIEAMKKEAWHNVHVAMAEAEMHLAQAGAGATESHVGLRFFNTKDWPCLEHPELLLGRPLGQYHCPHCGTMVCAGVEHITQEADIIYDMMYDTEGTGILFAAHTLGDIPSDISQTEGQEVPSIGHFQYAANTTRTVDVFIPQGVDYQPRLVDGNEEGSEFHTIGTVSGYTWLRLFRQEVTAEERAALIKVYQEHLNAK